MKQIKHKQSEVQRVIQRGTKFCVQHKDGLSSRENSGWSDCGYSHDTAELAISAMYTRWPLDNTKAA